MIGWDYSHTKQNGKTVFIFRDTDHVSESIADRLLSELEYMVRKNFFTVIFTEGYEGLYLPAFRGFATEEEFKKEQVRNTGHLSVVKLFCYRHQERLRNGELTVYGVDSKTLGKEQIALAKRLSYFESITRQRALTTEEETAMDWLIDVRSEELTKQRSVFSAQNIADYCNTNGLSTAGLIYGDGHYQQIIYQLSIRNIGYASYFPGEADSSFECVKNYIDKMNDYS